MCTVVNKYKSEFDVYIGRGSIWGNPFPITNLCSREEVIKKYKDYLWKQIQTNKISRDQLKELYGKRLGCFCKPKPCHGDVLVDAVNWAMEQNF